MPTQAKIDAVAELKEAIEGATMIVSTEYRGLSVQEMQALRRKLREGGFRVKVVKNTLLKLAAEAAGHPDMYNIIEGPTALAVTDGDVVEAAKALTDYSGSAPSEFAVRGGYLDGTVLSADDLKELTKIPPRPVLIAQLLGTLQSPLREFAALMESQTREFHGLTNALLNEFPGLIEARARQLEAEAA